ncbi:hypothetical protein [Piscinibacter sp. XHJ-5]|uniref:hypothetical protein n=1 Tax=Piscinibacter sp. XHJ-5 TaxID=3037797 RepID=UPI00245280E5|nr:hypothetical protein [Piscinibacter sp. XHJ-5]
MRRLTLDGHYGQRVEIDLCAPCHLVWFDTVESVRLTGTGLLALLGEMTEAQRQAHHVLDPDARCPRCAGALKPIHNRSRWGPTLQLECRRRHGAYQTFAQFLSEKGLVRPLSSADRAALTRRGSLHCLNCGAAVGPSDARCTYCDASPGMVDVARLAAALDPEGATEGHAVHGVAARHVALECLACGAPLPPGVSAQCEQCGATLAVAQLSQAHRAVSALEDALRSHARSPAPHVRARRLLQLEGDVSRRREFARQMQAEADAVDESGGGAFWDDLRERPWTVAAAAALLLFVWWLFYA